DLAVPGTDLRPLFDTILETIPAPTGDPDGPFQMLISTLDYSSYLGRIGIGRIERGRARVGERVALLPLGEPGLVCEGLCEEGKGDTGRQLRERLYREVERNVALRVEDTDTPYAFTVSGRGELHLGILMETMRREGYEFQISRPRIIPREGPNGEQLEPYEELMIDCPEGYLGVVMEKLGPRRAALLDMKNPGQGTVRMRFKIPARGLL